jgi:hypothetical protein
LKEKCPLLSEQLAGKPFEMSPHVAGDGPSRDLRLQPFQRTGLPLPRLQEAVVAGKRKENGPLGGPFFCAQS